MNESKMKLYASVFVLLAGLLLTVAVAATQDTTDVQSPSGIIIDFGNYDVVYTSVEEGMPIQDALTEACSERGFDLVVEGSSVVSIDGVESKDGHTWGLYAVERGQKDWSRIDDVGTVSDYTAVCYGYCTDEEWPAPAVDRMGVAFHGYDVPSKVVSLAPSATETICFNGGIDLLVGTDQYSNYPSEVVDRRDRGYISTVGSFTTPSFEMVLKQDPDLVVCISTQNAHLNMAGKLRATGVDVLVLDGGESIEAVLDNIYATGVVLGVQDRSTESIHDLQAEMVEVSDIISSYHSKWEKRVMVTLSAEKAPWVSGDGTYASDVMSHICVDNIYSDESGWVQVNSETIYKYNPEVIIIVLTEFESTPEDYDIILSSMSKEWTSTDAYKAGEVYLFTGDAADCASRAAPRVAELMELLGRAIHGAAFDDGSELPKYLGDDYIDYLTITRSDTE